MKALITSLFIALSIVACDNAADYSQCEVRMIETTAKGTKCWVVCGADGTYGWMACPDTTKVGATLTFINP